jgi:excisionase family DNA binding protein
MSKKEIEPAWTLQDVMQYFNVGDSRVVTGKLIKEQGLKFYKVGIKYRFRAKDVYEFEEQLKQISQEEIIKYMPIKRKRKCHAPKIDFEKKRINLEELRVI